VRQAFGYSVKGQNLAVDLDLAMPHLDHAGLNMDGEAGESHRDEYAP
jgi:hypothetical protein